MYRISYEGQRWYAVEFDDLEDEIDNITELVESGTPVLLVDDLRDARKVIDSDQDIVVIEED
jgi:hypothetical protein